MAESVILFQVRRVQHQPGAAEAKRRWQSGQVVPHCITLALDALKLEGPEVDQACGVEEPAVDRWEKGLEYPTWDQLCRLAVLTGFPVAFFTEPIDHLDIEPGIFFRRIEGASHPGRPARPVHTFTDKAINKTLGLQRRCPTCGHRAGTR